MHQSNTALYAGAMKVITATLPTDGGSMLHTQVWVDGKTRRNPLVYTAAWFFAGAAHEETNITNARFSLILKPISVNRHISITIERGLRHFGEQNPLEKADAPVV